MYMVCNSKHSCIFEWYFHVNWIGYVICDWNASLWILHCFNLFDVILPENWIWPSYCDKFYCAGNDGNYHASQTAKQGTQPVKPQPIEVPNISADELKEVTDNFGQDSLIGEGSYGRVYYGVLKSGQAAAIKNLDASKQPDEEFLAQVCISAILGLVFFLSGH